MLLTKAVLLAIGAYLLGSVSSSIIISHTLPGGDIRTHGSGNAGATNMARIYGLGDGLLTLGGDVLKALLAVFAGKWLLGDLGVAIGGLGSLIGHCFPIFYSFKGGKGVSVGVAISLGISWKVTAILAAVFFSTAFATKRVSFGSVCAAAAIIPTVFLMHFSTPILVLGTVTGLLVIYQHRSNIQRLLNGTEAEFKAAKTHK